LKDAALETIAMRALAVILALSMGLAACSKSDQAKNPAAADLSRAGAEAKAAGQDLVKAASDEAPKVKEAGEQLGQGLKKAGSELKTAGEKAGSEIKSSAEQAKQTVKEKTSSDRSSQ
jgi:hypothetical protein